MILLPLPRTRRIPDVHWIEYAWMIDEYGPNGEKVSPFWVRLWDGTWGPAIAGPLLRWAGRQWERRVEREGITMRIFLNHLRMIALSANI